MSDKRPVAWVNFPDISALSETTKDWVHSGVLAHPPLPRYTITVGPASPFTFQFLPSFTATPYFGGSLEPPLMPVTLPVEKREMPVVGYRAWGFSSKFRLGEGRNVALKSTGVDHHWRSGDNHATCTASRHPAPDQNCHCGYYVLANLDEVESHKALNDATIVGAVMGWGKVVQHGTEGWRAEYAKIIALLDCKYSKGQLRNTQQAAAAYGVEVKSRDALEHMVREFGDPFAVTP